MDRATEHRIAARKLRWAAAIRSRERWTDDERQSEEAELARQIAELIEAGAITICPPQTYTPDSKDTFNEVGINGIAH